MANDSSDDPLFDDQWFEKHPVVSTVLWLIGGMSKSPELPNNENIPRTNSRLSWADEHDGQIAEYIGSEDAAAYQQERRSSLQSHKSLTAYADTQRDDDAGPEGNEYGYEKREMGNHDSSHRSGGFDDFDESTTSPQWGWYVSTTPPQELYGKETSKNAKP